MTGAALLRILRKHGLRRGRAGPGSLSREGLDQQMSHTVDLEHDSAGWWLASARDIRGCHTQGRSIRQALSRMREALAACLGEDIAADQIEPCIHLPLEAREAVARYE